MRRPSSTTPEGVAAGAAEQVEVEDDAGLLEAGGAGDDLAVEADDDRVAVEDQLVLAAGRRQVGGGAPGLLGALAHQLQAGVVLLPLVGGGVDGEKQPGPGGARGGHPAALLPQVLADGEGDVDAVHTDHRHRLAGHEVAELVEDAVVGQVVLGEGEDGLAAVQHGGGVARRTCGTAEPRPGLLAAVEVADDHRQLPEALVLQPGGERVQRGAAGLDEGGPQREVLDGVARQCHLRERHQMGALLGGVPGPADDGLGVSGDVADAGVDLVQGETKLSHVHQGNRQSDAMWCERGHAGACAAGPPGSRRADAPWDCLAAKRDLVTSCAVCPWCGSGHGRLDVLSEPVP
ncbi:hypothetical protein GCM10020000_58040 [Streptomyces olivoverticillatus]